MIIHSKKKFFQGACLNSFEFPEVHYNLKKETSTLTEKTTAQNQF